MAVIKVKTKEVEVCDLCGSPPGRYDNGLSNVSIEGRNNRINVCYSCEVSNDKTGDGHLES